MNAALKATEGAYAVTIRAYQDDTTICGRASEIYGADLNSDDADAGIRGARMHLADGFLERGNKMHPTKSVAYASTEEERRLIPPSVSQPHFILPQADGSVLKAYGIEVGGAPIGDDAYVEEWLRLKSEELCAEVKRVSRQTAEIDCQASTAITSMSLQTKADFVMSTNLPSQTEQFAKDFDQAIGDAFCLGFGSNLLALTTAADLDRGTVTDPDFIRSRAQLRASKGGAAIRPVTNRDHFINTLVLVLPQLIDSTDQSGSTTTGLFNHLTPSLGRGSFDEANGASRWEHFLNREHSRVGREMKRQYEKGRILHMELLAGLGDHHTGTLPPSIYETPANSFGLGIKKLHKEIQDERQCLSFLSLSDRVRHLPVDDPRRMAFLANSTCHFNRKLLGSPPHPQVPFSSHEWTTAVACRMGIPVPCVRPLVGTRIHNHRNSPQTLVDKYAHNLTTVTGILGGGTAKNHNAVCGALSNGLLKAHIPHRGGVTDHSCKHIFAAAIPAGAYDDPTNDLKSIVPDIVVNGTHVESSTNILAGLRSILDVKTLAAGKAYQDTSVDFRTVVNKRQQKVNTEYHRRAAALDTRLHQTPPGLGLRGPFATILNEHGLHGGVIGPVVGFFGECSDHVASVRDLIVVELTKQRADTNTRSHTETVGMLTQQLNRLWGHLFARSWARLILDRLHDHCGARRNPTGTGSPVDSDETTFDETFAHFDRFNNQQADL
jgi:hypothetical protein